ncbi:MAG: fluoride efflux transporter CrcB [Muribaculaceae bacterium]|nr:fluoride efflux transporter CrcB [Muribaculaceae bacterium]
MSVVHILAVFIGGGAGSLARYAISRNIALLPSTHFPWPTFIANVAGCLLIGLLSALMARGFGSETMRLALVVGFCGGFTTFSTFSKETLSLLADGHLLIAAVYALGSVLAGLAAVAIGLRIAPVN